MCVIMYKQPGVHFDLNKTRDAINRAFNANPHGAGIMWYVPTTNKPVRYIKGLMSLKDVYHALSLVAVTDEMAFAMHFRIATHGGQVPETTHPFPVSRDFADMHQQYGKVNAAVMHNGVFHDFTPRDIGIADDEKQKVSDTMVWTKYVVHASFNAPRAEREVLYDLTRGYSRVLVFRRGEQPIILGSWEHDEERDLHWSNDSYREKKYEYGYGWGVHVHKCAKCGRWATQAELHLTTLPSGGVGWVCDSCLLNNDTNKIDAKENVSLPSIQDAASAGGICHSCGRAFSVYDGVLVYDNDKHYYLCFDCASAQVARGTLKDPWGIVTPWED